MFKYIVICITAASCSGCACPMGLGKQYANKPAFFHPSFYANKHEAPKTETTSHIVAQQNTTDNDPIVNDRRSS